MRLLPTIIGALVALAHVGCAIGPIPEPPKATVDVTKVFTEGDGHTRAPGSVSGGPGAVSPAGALVRIFPLDTVEDPVEGIVADDGSFDIALSVISGQEIRLQVLSDEDRSEPLDLIVGAEGENPVVAERPLAECLILEPPLELDLATTDVVVVENRCDEPVELVRPTLRRLIDGITVGVDGPSTVQTGGSISVTLELADDVAVEDILFIEATSPELDRRPITFIPTP